jgi:hypothetical protein
MITSNTKAYILFEQRLPNQNLSCAHEGFRNLGAETHLIYNQNDIYKIKDFGKDVVMCGFIEDVCLALKTINVEKPKAIDYPESLKSFLKREIKETTIGELKKLNNPYFIKPKQHKLFTGFVYDGSEKRKRLIVDQPDNTEIYFSEPINIVSEYRTFVLNNEIQDVKRYCGDWSVAPNKHFVDNIISSYEDCPVAYTADIGVLSNGENILIEVNDGFSFGSYGLNPIIYAKMLHARWNQMVS